MINLKAAKQIGLTLSPDFLARANKWLDKKMQSAWGKEQRVETEENP